MVTIPLSPFSARIILAHHEEPIRLKKNDPLLIAIYSKRTYPVVRSAAILTTALDFDIKMDPIDIYRAGYMIYQHHVNHMISHMLGAVAAGGQAYSAMKNYFDLYKIDPDEMDLGTMYKNYQRKSKQIDKKTGTSVLRNYQKKRTKKDPDHIKLEISHFCNLIIDDLFDVNGQFRLSLLPKIFFYIQNKYTPLTIRQMCKRYHISQATAYRWINYTNRLFSEPSWIMAMEKAEKIANDGQNTFEPS